jgi:Tellurite-like stress resistance cysteine protease StiP/PELOTA RNA binding domain
MPQRVFSGTYDPADVTILLKPVQIEPTPVAEKERLIQSGQRHYSEMLSHEALPSAAYLRVFHEGLERQKARLARHLLILARLIARGRPGPITLVSLARAGTPIGVLLTRLLRRFLALEVVHYSVSIIRDRGIDETALHYILERHPEDSLVFVDGWTGKGVISRELGQSVAFFNEQHGTALDPGLFAVADLCGASAGAATAEDYLIPSCVLGCTVSGLISRSVLNSEVISPGDFHGCVFYEQYRSEDLSRWFVEVLETEAAQAFKGVDGQGVTGVTGEQRMQLQHQNTAFLQKAQKQYKIRNANHIKPGVGEATRVLLRRVPDRLLLRDLQARDAAHLRVLASEKGVAVEVEPALPYQAVALIREVAP